MENKKIIETLQMQSLSEEEKNSRHILGRLYGPIATSKESTRNGRLYNKELWEKALNDEIFQEKVANKSLFLELGHPTDREETDMKLICACIPEMPKIVDGELYAYVDILDTDCGKLLKTLCDYGFVPGISSRGSGDVIGDEVDPDTFYLETWDIVATPAVKGARLSMQESLNTNSLNLKKALCESLEKVDEKQRKTMTESLSNLGISLEEESNSEMSGDTLDEADNKVVSGDEVTVESEILAESTSSEQTIEKPEEANNDGSEEIIKSLQEAVKEKSALETRVQELQEQLAVANNKVSKINEELGKYKLAISELSEKVSSKDLSEKVSTLEEELKAKDQTIESQKARINSLIESKKAEIKGKESLTESISKKDDEIRVLNENFDEIKSKYESQIKTLNESIEALKSDSEIKEKDYCEKLTREEKLVEKYRGTLKSVVNRYIESKATALGISAQEIKNKLSENYTIDEIDSICESLQSYALNISKLPISFDRKVKVKVHESTNESLNPKQDIEDVDDSLYALAGIDK